MGRLALASGALDQRDEAILHGGGGGSKTWVGLTIESHAPTSEFSFEGEDDIAERGKRRGAVYRARVAVAEDEVLGGADHWAEARGRYPLPWQRGQKSTDPASSR